MSFIGIILKWGLILTAILFFNVKMQQHTKIDVIAEFIKVIKEAFRLWIRFYRKYVKNVDGKQKT